MTAADEEIIQGIIPGAESAFRRLVETSSDLVYNVALGILQHHEDAENAAQEVFITLHHKAHTFWGESSLKTWIYRITSTHCIDVLRHRKRLRRFAPALRLLGQASVVPLTDQSDFTHPGTAMDRKEDSARVFIAIRSLPEDQRVAVTLQYREELSVREIAAAMDCGKKSVESLLSCARATMRKKLN